MIEMFSFLQKSTNSLETKLRPRLHLMVAGKPFSLNMSSSRLILVLEVKSLEGLTITFTKMVDHYQVVLTIEVKIVHC